MNRGGKGTVDGVPSVGCGWRRGWVAFFS